MLEQAGFEVTERLEPSYEVDDGEAIGTEPVAGSRAEAGAQVTMRVATRPSECNDIGTVPDSSFTDLGGLDAAAQDAVHWAVDVGLISEDTRFNPTTASTRGVAVTVLHRYMCEPTVGTSDFDDVLRGAFYTAAIDWAASTGVVSGTSSGQFKPDDNITRAEFVTIVWRAFGQQRATDSLPFDDVPSSAFYRNALRWAYGNGIINGTSATTFDPSGELDRVTLVVLFDRIERLIDPLVGPFD